MNNPGFIQGQHHRSAASEPLTLTFFIGDKTDINGANLNNNNK